MTARGWSEWLEPEGGEPVASYTSGVLAGRPAAIRHTEEDGRSSENGSYLFLLNHTEHEAEVELPPTAELVLGENPLPPLGVAIVREA